MEMKSKLTPKQMAFIREYCVDRNATQAAIRAGYSKKSAASIGEENLRKPDIRWEVDLMVKSLAEATETNADWVRRRLKEEGENFSEGASAAARIRAIELVGRLNGLFDINNAQHNPNILDTIPYEVLKLLEKELSRAMESNADEGNSNGSKDRGSH